MTMKCHVCGGGMQSTRSDMPFKTGAHSIVILKEMPVLQCGNCGEFLIEDAVMEQVEILLSKADQGAEVEIIRFAA